MLGRLPALLGFKRFNVLLRYFTACKSLEDAGVLSSLAGMKNTRKGPHQTYGILADLIRQQLTVLKLWKIKKNASVPFTAWQGIVVGAVRIAPKADHTDILFLHNLIKRNINPRLPPFKNHEDLQEQKTESNWSNLHLEELHQKLCLDMNTRSSHLANACFPVVSVEVDHCSSTKNNN